jgi:prepilin-type N-terminal cleavage/methylation domain-containing protein
MENCNIIKKSSKLAFSLVEMSMVILIIGILIAGISGGADLYSDYRFVTAKNLTKNSRVWRIEDLEM